ncbi:MAG: glutamyl-tRNA reductase, partial [Pseudomonadales bacterium]
SSTASDIPILGKGTVERAIKARRHKPIFMVDLAVPRDIEPEVNELADVYLYSMDDLQAIIADNLNSRADAAKDAELQIELAVDQFLKDAKSLDATDTLVKFRKSNETIKTKELEKALKSLKKGDDPESVLKVFASQLTNKLIHIPSVQIKQATIDERHDVLDAVEQLFQLDNDEQPDP